MSYSQNSFQVIKDPVHGTMQFTSQEDHWIKPFIDSPQFQRLRHIKQLGLGDLIFPGAVHTRFNHCLGCCYVASQIANKIGLAGEEKQCVIIACLLHDIGHGPFSHAFEEIFESRSIRHEDWTPYFFQEFFNDEFITSYNQLNPDFPLSGEKLLRLQAMIMHQSSNNKLLADIVSSQLDADRFDYLLRDSHFCGVNYGAYDFRWMLHVLTRVNDNGIERLGITAKGIGIVEHYLMARRLMMRNIYHNQKKVAIEIYLVKFLQIFSQSIDTDHRFSVYKESVAGKFLANVNHYNQSKQNKNAFLADNYLLYQCLSDYDVYLLIRSIAEMDYDHDCVILAKRLQRREMPRIITLDHEQFNIAKKHFNEQKTKYTAELRDWQMMLIETPHRSYTSSNDPILVDHGGTVKSLGEASMMIDAMSDLLEYAGFICVDTKADVAVVDVLLTRVKA